MLSDIRDIVERVWELLDEIFYVGVVEPVEVKDYPLSFFVLVVASFTRFPMEFFIETAGMQAIAGFRVFAECGGEGCDVVDFFNVRSNF